MKNFFYILLVLSFVSCSKKADLPPELASLATLASWVKNNEVTHAEVIIELATIFAEKDYSEEAQPWVGQITTYRKGLAELAVWEVMARQGRFAEARTALLQNSNLPSYGVGLQESEIIVRMTALADALGALPDLLSQWKRNGRVLPKYLEANLRSGFTQAGEEPGHPEPAEGAKKAGTYGAPDGPSVVQERMIWRGMGEGLAIRSEGLLSQGKRQEAADLLAPFLQPNTRIPVANLGQSAKILEIANRCGLGQEVRARLPELLADSDSISAGLTSGPRYRSAVIALLGQMGQVDAARTLAIKYRSEALDQLEPYFSMLGLADLAEGCWRAGLKELAISMWKESMEAALRNPNPRSQAVGLFEIWRGLISAGAPIPEDLRISTSRWLETIDESYARLGID